LTSGVFKGYFKIILKGNFIKSRKSDMKSIIENILYNMEKEIRIRKIRRFRPEATSIIRRSPTLPAKILVKLGIIKGKEILNFGSGRSVDSEYFRGNGALRVDEYDYFYKRNYENLGGSLYDIVVAFYVLNVVIFEEQKLIANTLKKLIKPGGIIAIAVREDYKSAKPSWIPYENGYITSKGTYQEFFHPIYNKGIKKLQNLFDNFKIVRIGRATYLIAQDLSIIKKFNKNLDFTINKSNILTLNI